MNKIVKKIVIVLIVLNIIMFMPIVAIDSNYTYAEEQSKDNVETLENQNNSENTGDSINNNGKEDKGQAQPTEIPEQNVENIRISKTKKTIYTGTSYKLKIFGTNKKVRWTTSDHKIATVNENGKVKAKRKGKVKISGKVSGKKYSCYFTIKSKSNNGVIYLTFDDGPSAKITPKVLEILKKENIKATFFVLNYSNSNEKIIKRIVREGHTIAIHGYSHDYSKIYKSKNAFMNNVYSLQTKIKKSTGVKTMYVRFPGGSSNTISRRYCKGIMTKLTKELLNKGFKYFDWNVCAEDAGSARNSTQVYNYVVKNLSKNRGNMVLMHDFATNQKGLTALPKIIDYAKKHGYTFAQIDDDTPMYAQHVNN